jgi:translation initiation factor IF-1
MVKNTIGGKKSKAFSRKDSYTPSNELRLPDNELECFAKVTKMFGNSMCQVSLLHNNLSLIAHIRAKMSGKNKRLFTIHLNDFLIVGLRHWESSPKHCDVIHIYSHLDISILSSLPSSSHLFLNPSLHHSLITNDDFDFNHSFDNNNNNNNNNNPSSTYTHSPSSNSIDIPFNLDDI